MSKVLFLSNVAPYPTDNGGKIFIMSLLKCLKKAGFDIDLFCYHDPCDSKTSLQKIKEIANVTIIENSIITSAHPIKSKFKAIKSLFSRYSFGIYKFKNRKMKISLKKSLEKEKYEYVFFGSLVMAPYFRMVKKFQPNAKIVLCEQNCENLIMRRRLDNLSNFLLKSFLKIEIRKLTLVEKKMLTSTNLNFILSKEDVLALEKTCQCKFKSVIIPIGLEELPIKKPNTDSEKVRKLLFVGTLSWEPNNSGLIWFLKNVLPQLPSNIEFNIIGKGASNEVKDEALKYPNVHILGYVDNLDSFFDESDLFVVPLFIGSGQRVKIIEAFSRAMPVISTSIGAEGLIAKNQDNILIADSADEFVNLIESSRNNQLRSIGEKGKRIFENNYSISAISNKIKEALKS